MALSKLLCFFVYFAGQMIDGMANSFFKFKQLYYFCSVFELEHHTAVMKNGNICDYCIPDTIIKLCQHIVFQGLDDILKLFVSCLC